MYSTICVCVLCVQTECDSLVFRPPKAYHITKTLNLFTHFTAGCIVNSHIHTQCVHKINSKGYTIFQDNRDNLSKNWASYSIAHFAQRVYTIMLINTAFWNIVSHSNKWHSSFCCSYFTLSYKHIFHRLRIYLEMISMHIYIRIWVGEGNGRKIT